MRNSLGPSGRYFIMMFFIADVPLSLVVDTALLPYDFIQGKRKSFSFLVHDDDGQPVPGVEINGWSKYSKSGSTDIIGRFKWASDPKDIKSRHC